MSGLLGTDRSARRVPVIVFGISVALGIAAFLASGQFTDILWIQIVVGSVVYAGSLLAWAMGSRR